MIAHKRRELRMQALHKRRIKREFERPAAELLPPIEARGVIQQPIYLLVRHHARHIRHWPDIPQLPEKLPRSAFRPVQEQLTHNYRRVRRRRRTKSPQQRLIAVIPLVERICKRDDFGQFLRGED